MLATTGVQMDDNERIATSNLARRAHRIPATTAQIPSNQSLQQAARSFWHERLSHHHHASELIEEVANQFRIDQAVIIGWVNLNNWARPEDDESGARIDQDENVFGVGADSLYQIKGIDRRMSVQELRELAVDPLYPFWCNLRNQYRRPAMTWLETTGAVNPGDIDLDEVQALLDQFPLTINQMAALMCVEPQVFSKYCSYYGIRTQRHAGTIDLTLGQLVHRHPALQQVVVRNSQWLYYRYAIPIHRLARYCNLQWEDLWAMGTRHGCWVLPEDKTLQEVEYLVSHHKL